MTACRTLRSVAQVRLGIGDDAAVLACPGGNICLTTDACIEGVHFRWELLSANQVGRKAAAASLSDIAAMGARPMAGLVSFHIPARTPVRRVLAVTRGIGELCADFGTPVVGGNVTRTPGTFGIDVTMVGFQTERWLVRSGAMPGDQLYLSGPTGLAAAGFHALTAGLRPHSLRAATRAWRTPRPRIRLGIELARNRDVHACIDVSDGLAQDLAHVAEASGVTAILDIQQIPVHRDVVRVAQAVGADPMEWVLGGGEDYELLVSAAPGAGSTLEKLGMIRVGFVQAGPPGVMLKDRGSLRAADPSRSGYRHL